jgi:UDPglucose--hexose-1-phosphate uridylyltransferase
MPELRTDWLTGRTVLVAENRAKRPNEFASSGKAALAAGIVAGDAQQSVEAGATVPACPFCAGNEHRTPPAVYEKFDAQGHWQIRVVPNMYPAVELEEWAAGDLPDAATTSETSAVAIPALGAHEVIVESPRHLALTSALSEAELCDVLAAYAARLRHWRDDGRFPYALVFKNQGQRAGASLVHLHSQLMALPVVPSAIDAELQRARDAFLRQGDCPYCRLIAQERASGERIIFDRDGYIAYCPFASWQPYEAWLLPVEHQASFEAIAPAPCSRLAGVLHLLIRRLEQLVPQAAYNMLLRTAPWTSDCDNCWHWRIELLPRIHSLAGLEMATGVHINPLPPERAARTLRPV